MANEFDAIQYLTPDGKPPQDYEAGARRDIFNAEEPRYCGHGDYSGEKQ
jgi:hypothetical protein